MDRSIICGKDNQLVNWANVTVKAEVAGKDDASVMVNRVCEDVPEPEPELPVTGATDIVAGALGAGSIVTLLGYAIASRKK